MQTRLQLEGWAITDAGQSGAPAGRRREGPPLLSLLGPDDRRRLLKAATRRRFADGAMIHMRGDPDPGLSIIHEGRVRFGNPAPDGSYLVASVLGPGEIFGEATLFANSPRTHEAVAVGATTIDAISAQAFFPLLDASPALARALLQVATARLYGALEALDDVQRLPLATQLAKLLLSMAEDGVVHATQGEVAERAGVSRVSVGKALAALKESGLVATGYGAIRLDTDKTARYIAHRLALSPLS